MSKARIASIVIGGALAIATPLVAEFEGSRLQAYLDPIGVPTICYGSTSGVRLGQTKTQAECDALLVNELGYALAVVDTLATVPMPDTRRAALASFVYNVGAGNFERSTLLRKLNSGDVRGACDELRRWTFAAGRQLSGLVRRREAERALCLQGL